jgi:hypothetical protein
VALESNQQPALVMVDKLVDIRASCGGADNRRGKDRLPDRVPSPFPTQGIET